MTNKFRDSEPIKISSKLNVPAGDYYEFDVFVTSSGGDSALSLVGATVTFVAAEDLDFGEESIQITKDNASNGGVIIMDAAGGQARIVLEEADTLCLGPDGGFLFYEVKILDSNLRLFTIASGSLILTNDIL